MLEAFGPTSDMIVAALLAIGQLITPVPEAGVQRGIKLAAERNACKAFSDSKALYAQKNCQALKSDRAQYKEQCQELENQVKRSEVQCATDPEIADILRFKPRPIAEYARLSNAELTMELHKICFAVQDRVFLEPEQWQNGEVADRDDLSDKLKILQDKDGGLQNLMKSILAEAEEGNFKTQTAYDVAMFLCHWKVDRKAVGQRVDFSGGLRYLQELTAELPNVDRLPELPQASFVYDDKNERIGEIYDREFVVRNGKYYISRLSRRRNVTSDQIPKLLMNAFIAIEDKRFPMHNGFDFEALKRLIYAGASGAKQGGSTFTMQLIKNAFFGADVEHEREVGKRTVRRKIKELLMIPMVEHTYSKAEILTYYLNLINLTSNAQGVQMAAMDMFHKDNLADLNLGEIALLAAMPKGASAYNPWRHPEAAKERRNLVLDAMADQGYISASDRDHWKAEPLKIAEQDGSESRVYSRFFTGHITNYFSTLKKKNARDTRWAHGGFDIKTSFNLGLQKAVTKSLQAGLLAYEKNTGRYKWKPWIDDTTGKNMNVARLMTKPDVDIEDVFDRLQLAHPYPETDWVIGIKMPKSGQWMIDHGQRVNVAGGDRGIFASLKPYDVVVLEQTENGVYRLASGTDVQGASVVLDVETGEVLAMSGGFTAGPYGKFAQNNRVTRSMRMPGSTVKPITYLYALNHGVAPNLILRNGGVRFPKIDNCPYHWAPHNYGGGGGGNVTVRHALENSMNLPVVNLFVHLAGQPESSDLAGIAPEQADKMRDTLYGIYDLAVAFGAYPSRQSLAERNLQQPCFPYLLGGFETTPLNMAQAYAAIANGGLRRDPIFLRQVFKNDQPLIVDHTEELRSQVMQYREAVKQGFNIAPEAFGAIPGVTAASVAQLHSLMQGVLLRGTSTRIKQWAPLVAGKTGTTNDSKDVWFDGYTNKIAVITWVGYDDDKLYDDLGRSTGGSTALPIFEGIMKSYFAMNPDALNDRIPSPDELPGVIHAKVDISSGYVYAVGQCVSAAPSYSVDEYFTEEGLPKLKRAAQNCAMSKNRIGSQK